MKVSVATRQKTFRFPADDSRLISVHVPSILRQQQAQYRNSLSPITGRAQQAKWPGSPMGADSLLDRIPWLSVP